MQDIPLANVSVSNYPAKPLAFFSHLCPTDKRKRITDIMGCFLRKVAHINKIYRRGKQGGSALDRAMQLFHAM